LSDGTSPARFRNDIVTGVGSRQVQIDDPSNPIELFEAILPEAHPGDGQKRQTVNRAPAALDQWDCLDRQLAHHLPGDLPMAPHDEDASLQPATSTAGHGHPTQSRLAADRGLRNRGSRPDRVPYDDIREANTDR